MVNETCCSATGGGHRGGTRMWGIRSPPRPRKGARGRSLRSSWPNLLCGGFHRVNGGTPKWMVFVRENHFKMDDSGVPAFMETPIFSSASVPLTTTDVALSENGVPQIFHSSSHSLFFSGYKRGYIVDN